MATVEFGGIGDCLERLEEYRVSTRLSRSAAVEYHHGDGVIIQQPARVVRPLRHLHTQTRHVTHHLDLDNSRQEPEAISATTRISLFYFMYCT